MISSLQDAEAMFQKLLRDRDIAITKKESRVKPGNTRIYTQGSELYHLKFTKKPFRPDPDKQGAARELHLKLHFAIDTFQLRSFNSLEATEVGTMVGLDEDLVLTLMKEEQRGLTCYVVTVLEREVALWIPVSDFYSFVMRYDTFIKFPRSGVPVCYVPTGFFLTWSDPKSAVPATPL
jgi:hypothetical protein